MATHTPDITSAAAISNLPAGTGRASGHEAASGGVVMRAEVRAGESLVRAIELPTGGRPTSGWIFPRGSYQE